MERINNTLRFLKRYVHYSHFIRPYLRTGSTHKVIVNSVPKSGTHLVMRALELTPGLRRAPIQLGRQKLGLLVWAMTTCPSMRHVILPQYRAQKRTLRLNERNIVAIDSDSPFYLTAEDTFRILDLLQPGWFAMGHIPYSAPFAGIAEQLKVKMIVMLRDPRDVVVSHANYLARKASHYMYPLYKTLSPEGRILASIRGVPSASFHPELLSIKERFDGILAWRQNANAYTTYFERLIGPQGGGTKQAQVAELRAILNHLDIEVSESALLRIANQTYGRTRTFSKGRSGQWRTEFDDNHRRVCKELIGDLLIELGYEKNLDW